MTAFPPKLTRAMKNSMAPAMVWHTAPNRNDAAILGIKI